MTTVRINATAHGPENAELTRTAVIRLNREKPYASAMLALSTAGRLEELLMVNNRSELVLENASPALFKEIEKLAANSNARLIGQRRSTTTLEQLFLDITQIADARMPNDEVMTKSK